VRRLAPEPRRRGDEQAAPARGQEREPEVAVLAVAAGDDAPRGARGRWRGRAPVAVQPDGAARAGFELGGGERGERAGAEAGDGEAPAEEVRFEEGVPDAPEGADLAESF
jgi:hypothetical protein